jgi:hypothetical protein
MPSSAECCTAAPSSWQLPLREVAPIFYTASYSTSAAPTPSTSVHLEWLACDAGPNAQWLPAMFGWPTWAVPSLPPHHIDASVGVSPCGGGSVHRFRECTFPHPVGTTWVMVPSLVTVLHFYFFCVAHVI